MVISGYGVSLHLKLIYFSVEPLYHSAKETPHRYHHHNCDHHPTTLKASADHYAFTISPLAHNNPSGHSTSSHFTHEIYETWGN